MYKLLIVEDEPIEREAIRMMVENSCDFIEIIAVLDNGYDAIEKAKELKPDIVIMDINMPGINGLDTIREMIKTNKHTKYLILSSYHRFEYAQDAISLGVEDFIVKPAKLSDIREALEVTAQKIEHEKQRISESTVLLNRMEEIKPIVENDCVYGLLYGLPEKEITKLFSFLGFEFTSGFAVVISVAKKQREFLESIRASFKELGLSCIGQEIYNKLVVFVFSNEVLRESRPSQVARYLQMLALESSIGCKLGVGEIADSIMGLQLSYKQAEHALHRGEGKNGDVAIYADELEVDGSRKISIIQRATQLSAAIVDFDQQEIQIELESFLSSVFLLGNNMSELHENIFQMFFKLECKLKLLLPQYQPDQSITVTLEYISSLQSVREIESYARDRVRRIISNVQTYRKQGSNNFTDFVLKQITSNYWDNISLESIAEELEITAFYLSRLIKKQMGKTFTELLTQRRIVKAKELLKLNKSIKEITFLTGFNSQNYFTKVFKKYVGVTPTEYRTGNDEGFEKQTRGSEQ